MPELLRRNALDTSTASTTPPGPDRVPGKLTRTEATATAAITPSSISRVKAKAGTPVTDVAGYRYEVTGDAGFRITFAPNGKGVGNVVAADGPYPVSWLRLAHVLLRETEPTPGAPPATTATEKTAPVPDAVPVVDGRGVLDQVSDALAPVKDLVHRLFGHEPAPAPAPASEPDPEMTPAETACAPRAGLDTNLAQAEALANGTAMRHTWDNPNAKGDPTRMARKNAIVAGALDKLKTIVCSEFTALTLRASGVDLAARYKDPATGLEVAFTEGGRFEFVDLYMVTNNQANAGHAILEAQRGNAKTIQPGSKEAVELHSKETAPFLHVSSYSYRPVLQKKAKPDDPDVYVDAVEVAPAQGDVFGAAATAVTLGGTPIAADDRKPGDLQQRWSTQHGRSILAGHSSQVWAVRGTGVVYLGAAGSPALVPAPKAELAPGWYAIGKDAKGRVDVYFEIGPETDPATIAAFDTDWVQLIDANVYDANRKTDATAIGEMKPQDPDYNAVAASSNLTSTGRLLSSRWFDWKPSAPVVSGVLGKDGVTPQP